MARRKDGLLETAVCWTDSLGSHKKVFYSSNKKELAEKVVAFKLKMRLGIDISLEKDTFGQWLDEFLKIKKYECSQKWNSSLESCSKHFGEISNIQIKKLKSTDFQNLILKLSAEKDLSTKTLKTIKSIALQVFDLAIDNRVLDCNPVSKVKIPQKESNIERRGLSEQEQGWIINTPHKCQTACMIMMFAGLRRGELIPLMWSDIDLKNGTIDVNKSVEIINGKSILKKGGKTASATRIIEIPKILVNYLSTIKKTNMLVCPSAKGELMSEASFNSIWSSYLTELNLKYGDFSNCLENINKSKFSPKKAPFVITKFTPHWLRHTFATLLYMAGIDVLTAKEQLGHSDIKTTLNIYTHLDKKFKKKSINKLDAYLNEEQNKNISFQNTP